MKKERQVFETFIKTCGDFAGESVKVWYILDDWYRIPGNARPTVPFDNRPDIICITDSDKRVGIELKAWLNEGQIAEAKRQESFQDAILRAIGELPINDHKYIQRIWLRVKPKRFHDGDSPELRNQLFELIRQRDERWSEKPKWDQSSREMIADLTAFPTVAKYIDFVEAFPRREPIEPDEAIKQQYPDRRWIAFPNRGGAYTLTEMLTPLQELLVKTKVDNRYRDICKHVGLSECYLLVHYDWDAFAYNTPIDTPNHSFRNVVDFARNALEEMAAHSNTYSF